MAKEGYVPSLAEIFELRNERAKQREDRIINASTGFNKKDGTPLDESARDLLIQEALDKLGLLLATQPMDLRLKENWEEMLKLTALEKGAAYARRLDEVKKRQGTSGS